MLVTTTGVLRLTGIAAGNVETEVKLMGKADNMDEVTVLELTTATERNNYNMQSNSY